MPYFTQSDVGVGSNISQFITITQQYKNSSPKCNLGCHTHTHTKSHKATIVKNEWYPNSFYIHPYPDTKTKNITRKLQGIISYEYRSKLHINVKKSNPATYKKGLYTMTK